MRSLIAGISALALAYVLACGNDYNLETPAGAPEAGAADVAVAPTDEDAGTDAATDDAEPEAGARFCASQTSAILCDDFEDDTIAPAWSEVNGQTGQVVVDEAHPHGGRHAAKASFPSQTSSANANGDLQRTVSSNGEATWTTWVWMDSIVPANPIRVLQASFTNTNGEGSAVSLQIADGGPALLVEAGDPYDNQRLGQKFPFNRWVKVTFGLDFQNNKVSVQFDDASVASVDFDFKTPPNLGSLTLLFGVTEANMPPATSAWFDDMTFVANTP